MKVFTEEELRGSVTGAGKVARWIRAIVARPAWIPQGRPLPETWLAHAAELRQVQAFDAKRTAKFRADLSVLCRAIEVTSSEVPVDDRMRVLLCGTAALLLTGRDPRWLDHVARFTVRRDTTRTRDQQHMGEYRGRAHPLLGVAGEVVVAWSEVEYDVKVPDDGNNVMLHELAHAVDHRFGGTLLQRDRRAARWREATRELVGTWSTAPGVDGAELFAVTTELLFERPRELRDAEPELYAEMVAIYAVDPLAW